MHAFLEALEHSAVDIPSIERISNTEIPRHLIRGRLHILCLIFLSSHNGEDGDGEESREKARWARESEGTAGWRLICGIAGTCTVRKQRFNHQHHEAAG